MIIGYARVSTYEQDTSLQIDALEKIGCEKIFEESKSGRSKDRPELIRCMDTLRQGDLLVVWRLDRLGKSLRDLLELISDLENKGVGFQSLTESIDTTSTTGKLIFMYSQRFRSLSAR